MSDVQGKPSEKRKRKHVNSLEELQQIVRQLEAQLKQRGIYIPPPPSPPSATSNDRCHVQRQGRGNGNTKSKKKSMKREHRQILECLISQHKALLEEAASESDQSDQSD
eukprot:comp15526_c1_seq1/m.12560 comp15526_c1_seq1/g.12560  ORF comp15526_c1_seq1/g.12560 comp15526_c1_seq1/m.12560 type:complete len:109 (-) comp15526_c1_seq1:129-455(-)